MSKFSFLKGKVTIEAKSGKLEIPNKAVIANKVTMLETSWSFISNTEVIILYVLIIYITMIFRWSMIRRISKRILSVCLKIILEECTHLKHLSNGSYFDCAMHI